MVQNLPPTLDWSEDLTPFGSPPPHLYFSSAIQPTAQAGHPGWAHGAITDAYLSSLGPASALVESGEPAGSSAIGFVFHLVHPLETRVSMTAQVALVGAGAVRDKFLDAFGVTARVQDDVSTVAHTGSSDVFDGWEVLTCYEFRIRNTNPPGGSVMKFELVRWNDGVPTLLATGTTIDFAGGNGNLTVPFGLRLEVTEPSPGEANLKGYRKIAGASSWTLEVDHTESGGSTITTAGRSGFYVDRETVEAGPSDIVSIVHDFEVVDLSTSTEILRDEFDRQKFIGARLSDLHGAAGYADVASLFEDGGGFGTAADLAIVGGQLQVKPTASGMGDPGAAALAGDGVEFLTMNDPSDPFDGPFPWNQGEGELQMTIAVWALLDANIDGNELYDAREVGTKKYLQWGLRTAPDIGGQAAAHFEVRVGGEAEGAIDTTDTFVSSDFVIAGYLGKPFCYILVFKSKANPGDLQDVAEFYIGRHRRAVLIDSVAVGEAGGSRLLLWPKGSSADQQIGVRQNFAGTNAETYLDGTIDSVAVVARALQDGDLDFLCDEAAIPDGGRTLPDVWEFDGIFPLYWNFDDNDLVSGQRTYWQETFENIIYIGRAFQDVADGSPTVALRPDQPLDRLIMWAARPELGSEGQRRRVKATVPNFHSRAGVIVHGAVPSSHDGDAYFVEIGEGALCVASVFRMVDGVLTLLAVHDLASGTVGVDEGVPFTVDLESEDLTDHVVLRVKVDGASVPLVSVVDSPEVGVNLSGDLVDASTDRLRGGTVVGIIGSFAELTEPGLFDDWTSLAPTVSQDRADETPSYAIPAEAADWFGDLADVFDISPLSWDVTVQRVRARSREEMESGRVKTLAHMTRGRRVLLWTRKGITPTEEADFVAFWNAHKGAQTPFNVQVSQYVPRQADGFFVPVEASMSLSWAGPNDKRVTFQLVEVHST